jgi:uncharacterized membrane protein
MVLWVLVGLVALAIPFILPLVSVVSMWRLRRRLRAVETSVEEQARLIEVLGARLLELTRAEPRTSTPQPPAASEPIPSTPPLPVREMPAPAAAPSPPAIPPSVERPPQSVKPPAPPRAPLPAPPVAPPGPSLLDRARGFDWESLIGVKLFSAIAGIALLLAAVFFLRYSVEHGWLQPAVRVAIGIIVGIGLLVVCELKAARDYPATANALDASGIAILFATFFSAHALWHLIPGVVAFALLALVTAVAVALSIRRESLFIAVLGLLGGFATPALLSTGENRPVPLFTYLLLLNIGLAWVSYRQAWPVLSWLTVLLTAVYQWGWVIRFLTVGQLSLAMGIFLLFPLVSVCALALGNRSNAQPGNAARTFERTALIASALPLFFAAYLASTPGYAGHPWLLLGFLLVIDLGLIAIAIARREDLMFSAAALATFVVTASLLAVSYWSGARHPIVVFTAGLVILFLFAPWMAARFERPFGALGARTAYAAPLMLFTFPVLLGIEPAFARPWAPLGTLLVLIVTIAWRSAVAATGAMYFIAAFFAVAAQATWSARHLGPETLGTGVSIYAAFGLAAIAIPIVARRTGRRLEPASGAGFVLLASLPLLFFLAMGDIAPEALWALALLLAVLNAGVFIESAVVGLPLVSFIGSLVSWAILATWWTRASGSVGTLASLTVLAGMTLVTLGGYAWSHQHNARIGSAPVSVTGTRFSDGLFLGLIGHLFLLALSSNPEWSMPPWPLFGTLAVMTLATSVASIAVTRAALHVSGTVAASLIVLTWMLDAGTGWGLVGLLAAAGVSAFALAWQSPARLRNMDATAAAAASALLIGEFTAMAATARSTTPFAPLVIAHVANLSIILALTWARRWRHVAIAAAIVGWIAAATWQSAQIASNTWGQLIVLSLAIYSVFIVYPLVLGRRAGRERDPYVAAVVASAMLFFAMRSAFQAAGLTWMIGVIPVAESAVLMLLFGQLLRIEAPGDRDLGRLALVGGATLAFITVAIPLQLDRQWITIGWALEGAALAWLYGRIPHRGLLYAAVALLAAVFVRLVLNPDVFQYEPRGPVRIFNWYLYAYELSAAAMIAAGWWFSTTDDRIVGGLPHASRLLPAAAGILLFVLLNIEIADFYATGPEITFRFGAGVSQDLTYTIGWLFFGMLLLAVGIWRRSHATRVAAVILIAVTTCKCFLYDLASLEGLYRVASFVGLGMSLILVSMVLQKFVLARPKRSA